MIRNSLSILLVEDNEDDAVLIEYAIDGVRSLTLTSTVPDGVEAMRYLRKEGSYAESERPDLVLLDINLPKKNGFEVLNEIKKDQRFSQLPVIIFTTSKNEDDVKRAYANGASSFVVKPTDLAKMRQATEDFGAYWTSVARIPIREGSV